MLFSNLFVCVFVCVCFLCTLFFVVVVVFAGCSLNIFYPVMTNTMQKYTKHKEKKGIGSRAHRLILILS